MYSSSYLEHVCNFIETHLEMQKSISHLETQTFHILSLVVIQIMNYKTIEYIKKSFCWCSVLSTEDACTRAYLEVVKLQGSYWRT